jgi:hypothetical protein
VGNAIGITIGVLGVAVAYRQWLLQRNQAGSRGILFRAQKIGWQVVVDGEPPRDKCRVSVELVGAGVRSQVAVHIEIDGETADETTLGGSEAPQTRKLMSSADDPIE